MKCVVCDMDLLNEMRPVKQNRRDITFGKNPYQGISEGTEYKYCPECGLIYKPNKG